MGTRTPGASRSQGLAAIEVLDVKQSVRAATTAALPASTYANGVLTADANGALAAQDGVTLVADERLLVKDQGSGLQNGLYVVTQVGTAGTPWILTRAADADTSAEVTAGLYMWVTEGTTNADTAWTLTTDDPITLGTTSLAFTQFSALGQITAGAGLTKTGSTLDVGAGVGITVNANDVAVALGYAFAWTEAHTWTKNAIGTAQTAAITIANNTDATNGAQQYSGMTVWKGEGWDSTAGVTKDVEFAIQNRPVQAAGDPTGVMDFLFRSNAGAWTKPMTLTSAGKATVTQLGIGSWTISNNSDFASIDTGYMAVANYGFRMANSSALWNSTALVLAAGNYIEGTEITEPAAPAADKGRIYFDVSGVKTRLMVRFQSGPSKQIQIED